MLCEWVKFTSKISQVGLPYHPGQLNMLGNRTHSKQNGRQGKGSGSYCDSAVVAASYSYLSVPWSFFLNNFSAATTTSLVHRSPVILTNVLYLFFDSIISFLDCQLFLIVLRFETFVFLFAHILNACFRFGKAWRSKDIRIQTRHTSSHFGVQWLEISFKSSKSIPWKSQVDLYSRTNLSISSTLSSDHTHFVFFFSLPFFWIKSESLDTFRFFPPDCESLFLSSPDVWFDSFFIIIIIIIINCNTITNIKNTKKT